MNDNISISKKQLIELIDYLYDDKVLIELEGQLTYELGSSIPWLGNVETLKILVDKDIRELYRFFK